MSDITAASQHAVGELPPDRVATTRGQGIASDPNVTYDVLALDARTRQSLVAIRSLGSRGLQVAAVGTRPGLPAFSSRWCRQALVWPIDEGSEEYFDHLNRLLDDNAARVLITSSDATVALIRRHRQHLEQRMRIALAAEPALGIAMNKEQTLNIAGQLGLGIPRSVRIEASSEVPAAVREIGLPAVIKPVQSWVWREGHGTGIVSQLVTTRDAAQRAAAHVESLGVPMYVQQFLGGRREAVMFLYAHGEMCARFAQWAKRTVPALGGVSVLRQSIPMPQDIGAQAERLVREIGLEGYSEVEFRRDCEGKAYLMEINARLSASVEVAVRAGVNFPYLLYQWASGDRVDVVKSYRTGLWMRYLSGDLMTLWEALHCERGRPDVPPPARAMLDFCLTFLTSSGYDYVNWKDPLPACLATTGFLHDLLSQLRKHAGRGVRSWHSC